MIKPTKFGTPKKHNDSSTTDTSDDESEYDNIMEDIIVNYQ